MRRGVGISGLQRQQRHESQLKKVGSELGHQNAAELRRQLDALRQRIEGFAFEHRGVINRDPVFRAHFNRLCAASGVDPLKSSKGVWAQLLGVGDFYYELAVQVADVCMSTRAQAGGLIAVGDLHARLGRKRGGAGRAISRDDVLCAVAQLRQLGGGYAVSTFGGGEQYVRCVPLELDADHNALLTLATPSARVTRARLAQELGWAAERADAALATLLREGVLWVDVQGPTGEPEYWVPCIWQRAESCVAPADGGQAGKRAPRREDRAR
ncbi:hypothetical protein KFE25_012362 [Diacronema lutheri]|uniref:Vacuolar-sorting protein SNF8 n=2 Tax=Diacronema lutheri TaxID=2081491 RepID=A0A8J5XL16_DIALT|nr:hypothetical protein KFE25_012362 [Diacronema lutheri]